MNSIIIHGRITKAPELKTVGSGSEVCKFTVAVNRPVGKDKEKVADFFDVDAWGQSGVFVEKYFKVGDGIIVQGEMQSRKYEKDGEKRTAWGIHANRVEFAEKKGEFAATGNNNGGFTEVQDENLPF
jgi:single-strand DNA-binding protein